MKAKVDVSQFALVLLVIVIFHVKFGDSYKLWRQDGVDADIHPLDPLSPSEIEKTAFLIRTNFSQSPFLQFSIIMLKEPPKSQLVQCFLEDTLPTGSTFSARKAFANVVDPQSQSAYEIIVNLEKEVVEEIKKLDPGTWPPYMDEMEDIVKNVTLKHPKIIDRIHSLGIKNITRSVVAIIWDFGYSEDRPELKGRRMAQVFFGARSDVDDNFYAHPMDFLAIVDLNAKELLDIEDLPTHEIFHEIYRERETSLTVLEGHNYDPKFFPEFFYRQDLNPVTIDQPQGASYRITGNQIEWQNFKMRIGFNAREGIILHHINYRDKEVVRPLIYRMSFVEIFVPYGDPRSPLHRKRVFDEGELGIGVNLHPLHHPGDCKGVVKFFDVVVNSMFGRPVIMPNSACIYEEDSGTAMRKFNSRTGRSYIVRDQRLVITSVSTFGNYDYQFKWIFHLDASIKGEVQLDGIVSVNLIATPTGQWNGYGTIVAPYLNAIYHQHFFVARVDVDIDGTENTAATLDVVSAGPTGSKENAYGNGFKTIRTLLRTPLQARTDANITTSRTWALYGDLNVKHPYTNTPKGYKLISNDHASLMINQDSPLYPQCAFVDYDFYATLYNDDQIYPGGKYLNKSGLPEWVAKDADTIIENKDIVIWKVLGVTHIPRVEDFPVMTKEIIGFWLKPNSFFLENPALDVPAFVFVSNSSTGT